MTHRALLPLFALAVILASRAEAAGPVYWDYPDGRPFAETELHGAALDAQGRLIPGVTAQAALADSSRVYWRAVSDGDGGYLVASGHDGQIWRLASDGKARLLAKVPATEVFALLADDGGVIAGCGPQGQVYRIDHDGTVTERGAVEGGYVWAIRRAADGAVYLATGSPAAVYRLPRQGDVEKVVALPATNALDLAVDTDGRLLVATQGPGRVFAVDPHAKKPAPELLLEVEQDEVRQILRGPDGWYVLGLASDDDQASDPGQGSGKSKPTDANPFGSAVAMVVTPDNGLGPVRSALYALTADVPRRIWASDRELMIAAWSATWGWVGAGKRDEGLPTTVMVLDPPSAVHPLATWNGGDILDLLAIGKQGATLVVSQAHPGEVSLLTPTRHDAAAFSEPLDGDVTVRWGRLRARTTPRDAGVRFAVRTGAGAHPDTTWSEWVDLDRGDDVAIPVAPSRYLQWRATFNGNDPDARVDAVSVSAFAPNLPPEITIFEPQPGGEIVSGGMLGGNDNATQKFDSGLKVEYSTTSRSDRRLDRERAAALRPLRTFAWHAIDPNHDRLEFQLEYQRHGDATWRPIADPTPDPVLTWDTSDVPDGDYAVRLRASDRPDNPAALATEAQRTLPEIEVDNTPPVLDGLTLEAVPTGLRISLRARDAGGPLAGAQVILPDGTSERLDPRDGICDSATEEFRGDLVFPRPDSGSTVKPWRVRVQVWDLAGNVATAEGTVP